MIRPFRKAKTANLHNFRTFLKFSRKKNRWNFLIFFPGLVHPKGCFGEIKKNSNFRHWFSILDNYRHTLLNRSVRSSCICVWAIYIPIHPAKDNNILLTDLDKLITRGWNGGTWLPHGSLSFYPIPTDWCIINSKSAHSFRQLSILCNVAPLHIMKWGRKEVYLPF